MSHSLQTVFFWGTELGRIQDDFYRDHTSLRTNPEKGLKTSYATKEKEEIYHKGHNYLMNVV